MSTLETSANLLTSRSIDYYEIEDYESAIQELNEAIRLNDKDKVAYRYRGLSKYKLSQPKEAIKDFSKAISIDSEYGEAYVNRSIASIALENYEIAIQDCDEAIRINPHNVEALVVRALAKNRLGVDSFVEDLERVIHLNLRFPKINP